MITPIGERERVEIANELIDALRAAQSEGSGTDTAGAMTSKQLAVQLGWCTDRVRAMLAEMIDAGQVEPCKIRTRTISGSWHRVPAYRFVAGASAGGDNGNH